MKQDGGPAFPIVYADTQDDKRGMSLRDYFAAAAVQAICSNPSLNSIIDKNTVSIQLVVESRARVSKTAYEIADAMLAERDK